MENNITEFEYVTFERDGLEDFRDVILPDVYGDLFVLDDFEESAVFAVGALADGIPAAAVIAQRLEENIVELRSISVLPQYQRRGIGTGLIEGVLSEAKDAFLEAVDPDLTNLEIVVRGTYILPEKELAEFEKWLRNNGFRDFFTYPDIYMFGNGLPEVKSRMPETVHPLADLRDVTPDEMDNFLREQGFAPLPELSFFTGSTDDPSMMALTVSQDAEYFQIMSFASEEVGTEDEYIELIGRVFREIQAKAPDAVVSVDPDKNLYPKVWNKLAKKGTVLKRREAGLYVRFV